MFFKKALHLFLAFSVFASALIVSGCAESVKEKYPLVSVSQEGNQRSYVYKAEGKTVPQIAKEIAASRTPDQMSVESDKQMFLVYSDELYNIQKDPQAPSNTIIELSNKEFAKSHYESSFLQNMLTAAVVASLFDNLSDSQRHVSSSPYRGYSTYSSSSGGASYRAPTAEEKKAAPPSTTVKSGAFTKSSSSSSSISSSSAAANPSTSAPTAPSTSSSSGAKASPPKTSGGSTGTFTQRK